MAVLLLATILLSGCSLFEPKEPELPVPLKDLIPDDWQYTLDGKGRPVDIKPINVDGDPENEWIYFFHYDNGPNGKGPVGGIIYDAQQDTSAYQLDPSVIIPFPYQPTAFLVPYRLLPDWRPGKGQGYLADTRVTWSVVDLDPLTPNADELVIQGLGPGGVTRLTLVQWRGVLDGYAVAHFIGSGGVTTSGGGENALLLDVTTSERLYERSNLCKVTTYSRQGNGLQFTATAPKLQFCQGTPEQPTHPEAVVLGWILSGNTNLIIDDRIDAVEGAMTRDDVTRVISLIYKGEALTSQRSAEALSEAEVTTIVESPRGKETHRWLLEELRPKSVPETSRWRIREVFLEP